MGKVTIEFHGVCVHVRRAPMGAELPAGVDHRVVVIDGRQGRNVNGHAIAPHVPRVEVYDERPEEGTPQSAWFYLDKQRLRIDGAPDGQPAVLDSDRFRCAVPPLLEFFPTLSLASRVIVDGEEAAGFFDLSGGTIHAELRHVCAGVAVFESPVEDHATLQSWSMGGTLVGQIPLSGDAWIIVSNVGGIAGGNADPSHDGNADFLLNYLVSGTIPDDASFPTECRHCPPLAPTMTFPFHSIGPGCSNTQYP